MLIDVQNIQMLFSKKVNQTASCVKCNSPQEEEQQEEEEQQALLDQEFHFRKKGGQKVAFYSSLSFSLFIFFCGYEPMRF